MSARHLLSPCLNLHNGSFFLTFLLASELLFFLTSCTSCQDKQQKQKAPPTAEERIRTHALRVDTLLAIRQHLRRRPRLHTAPTAERIHSGTDFEATFPDLNPLQVATAAVLGIPSIQHRADAEQHKEKLILIEGRKGYAVRPLTYSIPYLIPRAARLLAVIAQNFSDSLTTKGLPPYQLIVSSVLRTEADVERLRRVNRNASDNSCHRYGTTFDITYNQFVEVETGKHIASLRLKNILGEVLDDLRSAGCCYVKYEKHQSCFHITCR